jgi:hypothetical protein
MGMLSLVGILDRANAKERLFHHQRRCALSDEIPLIIESLGRFRPAQKYRILHHHARLKAIRPEVSAPFGNKIIRLSKKLEGTVQLRLNRNVRGGSLLIFLL